MPMRKPKVLPSTGGGGLVLTAVGLYASGWPEIIRLHPMIPLLILLGGLALLIWSFYRPPEVSDPKIAPAIGRDNFGQQMSAGRDINTEHHYHTHNRTPEKPPEHVEKPRSDDSAAKQLRLRVDGIEIARLRYEADEGLWIRGDESDRKGLLIWITNDEAPIGQPNQTAKKLMALLQFRSCNRAYRASASRAYWLERYFNQVDLEVGHRHAVIVGIDADDVWQAYENNVTVRLITHFEGINSYVELPDPSLMPKGECIRFAITLIEGKNQHSVFKCAFRINFPQIGNWYAVAIEESEL